MIASLRGSLLEKRGDRVVLDCGGVGYEVLVTPATAQRLPPPGGEALLHVAESFGLYGGGATFYGFSTPAEKALFETFKERVPGTGAKKALEYLERAGKSLPDFRRAVVEKDAELLRGAFGFTRKTAGKLIESLKDALGDLPVSGPEKLSRRAAGEPGTAAQAQALSALGALGYKPAEARAALQAASEEGGAEAAAERLVRLALKKL
ncbi:MAG: hypothetical protein KGO96_03020 [Elusimicrobia bacterium]|nr:hypothetical protein [Elusimicrobiota bacterium]MDE2236624.1 hypothetical protein [Elusimicrobiota bacterium]MDE2424864.1 hypothetical protein [Elusimicrobiota bacterium]